MDSHQLRVNLVYNKVLRTLEINSNQLQKPISEQINDLFRDENCHCLGVSSQDAYVLLPIQQLNDNLTALMNLASSSCIFLYVLGESKFGWKFQLLDSYFKTTIPSFQLTKNTFNSFLE